MHEAHFETLIGLVSHYSPSGGERSAAGWLAARMKSMGYDDAFVDETGNAVGLMGRGPRQVVLLGHIDTVPGEIPLRVEQDALYGRGTADAKGPLACFVDAVAGTGARDGWQLIVIGAVEEERDSDGARHAAERYQPEFAIIGEPNRWDRLALGYKGNAWAEVTVTRGQSHSASGEQTAAEAAVELWSKVKAFVDSFNADKPRLFDRLLPTLRGLGSGANDFEQWARMQIGVRLPLEVSPQDWYGILHALAAGANIEPLGYPVPAWKCEKNTPLVRALLRGIRSLGGEPRFVLKTGTADLNIVAPIWNCPAVVYGPGDSALDHTPHERIELADFQNAVRVLVAALDTLMN
jgi:LysW-gamma-L-lysine carboxypeptidase